MIGNAEQKLNEVFNILRAKGLKIRRKHVQGYYQLQDTESGGIVRIAIHSSSLSFVGKPEGAKLLRHILSTSTGAPTPEPFCSDVSKSLRSQSESQWLSASANEPARTAMQSAMTNMVDQDVVNAEDTENASFAAVLALLVILTLLALVTSISLGFPFILCLILTPGLAMLWWVVGALVVSIGESQSEKYEERFLRSLQIVPYQKRPMAVILWPFTAVHFFLRWCMQRLDRDIEPRVHKN